MTSSASARSRLRSCGGSSSSAPWAWVSRASPLNNSNYPTYKGATAFIQGIFNSPILGFEGAIFQGKVVEPMPVVVNYDGQLGILPSSARFKRDIEDMRAASSPLLRLRPVTFRYGKSPDAPRRYGLIAEEVESIYPELVAYGGDGKVLTVRYDELPAMLLNELQKQVQENARQAGDIATLTGQLAELAARLGRLEAAEEARATVASQQ